MSFPNKEVALSHKKSEIEQDADLVERLSSFAYERAGGGPGDPNYDPECLCLIMEAVERLQTLSKEVKSIKEDDYKLMSSC